MYSTKTQNSVDQGVEQMSQQNNNNFKRTANNNNMKTELTQKPKHCE